MIFMAHTALFGCLSTILILVLIFDRSTLSTSLSWTEFFSQELYLTQDIPETNTRVIHHVYFTPPSESAVLFVMHHGAGSSGLSFATCAEEIRKLRPKAGLLSLDCREHGSTQVTKIENGGREVDIDLNLETLSQDLLFVIHEIQPKMGWASLPDIVLVGHSLGGAVITDVAKKGALGQKLLAYAVLDVVEGIHSSYLFYTCILIPYRLRNGRPPKHGKIPRYPSNPLPISILRNRMAVCSLYQRSPFYSNH